MDAKPNSMSFNCLNALSTEGHAKLAALALDAGGFDIVLVDIGGNRELHAVARCLAALQTDTLRCALRASVIVVKSKALFSLGNAAVASTEPADSTQQAFGRAPPQLPPPPPAVLLQRAHRLLLNQHLLPQIAHHFLLAWRAAAVASAAWWPRKLRLYSARELRGTLVAKSVVEAQWRPAAELSARAAGSPEAATSAAADAAAAAATAACESAAWPGVRWWGAGPWHVKVKLAPAAKATPRPKSTQGTGVALGLISIAAAVEVHLVTDPAAFMAQCALRHTTEAEGWPFKTTSLGRKGTVELASA